MFGCGLGECGACRLHVDGELTFSCQTPVSAVEGKAVTTIEGLSGRVAEAVYAAWEKHQVVHCEYCRQGQIMAATALLMKHPRPSGELIASEEWMGRSVCNCTAFERVRDAILDAAESLDG
jgi:isoquinoline 1-oxidoreductase subunit alpha